ncbi:MAG: hypothetical protein H0T71_05200, partial [Acidobacteria bacterium]|nr:hypothetical protein [Acidobacteriota bacterium]
SAPGASRGAAPAVPEDAATARASLAAEARAAYDRAIAAQKAGDWARYGDEIRQLGEILQRMRQ